MTSGGNSDTFGFDLHTSADGWGVALNLESVQIFYAGQKIAIGGAAAASSVTFQNLPVGHRFNEVEQVRIAFTSANLRDVIDDVAVSREDIVALAHKLVPGETAEGLPETVPQRRPGRLRLFGRG